MLRNIFPSPIVTSLPELKELRVRDCDEWEGIFCEEESLRNLSSSSNVCFPKLQNIEISGCNKVKRLFPYSLASHCPSLEKLDIWDCSKLESLVEEEASNEDILPLLLKLKILILQRLPKLREIFGGRFEGKLESLHNKQECSPHKQKNERVKIGNLELISINLQRLPELEYIWKCPTQSVSLHRLEYVSLDGCPMLRNIFTSAIVTSLPELKELRVRDCDEWQGIFCEEESFRNPSSSSNVCFPKLQNIEISGCNKVKRLFPYSLASHCPSLEKLGIWDCSELESLVDEEASNKDILPLLLKLKTLILQGLPKLREIFGGRFEGKLESLHNKQECSPHKQKNERVKIGHLELISMDLQRLQEPEYIWKCPTQSVSLHRLEYVSLDGCPMLRNIFTSAIVTSLPELKELRVRDCDEWEGIFCEEESLRNPSSSSNVCFPKLQNIEISGCNKVKRLFPYSLASHCPSLEKLGIWDCSELESLVDEEASNEDILPLLLKLKTLILQGLPKLREIFGRRFEGKLESLHNKPECSPHVSITS